MNEIKIIIDYNKNPELYIDAEQIVYLYNQATRNVEDVYINLENLIGKKIENAELSENKTIILTLKEED